MSKEISRKKALQQMGGVGLSPLLPSFMRSWPQGNRPNIVMILCDQFRADACKRGGFGLDTTPFLDGLAAGGTWFNKAYCAAPACVPSRTSLQTGRFPNATRVKSNHNIRDAAEVQDHFNDKKYKNKKLELLEDMLAWELRSQDPLPLPRRRYVYRGDKHNYWTPCQDPDVM